MRCRLLGWAISALAIACSACSSGGADGGGGSTPAATLVAITVAPSDPSTIVGGTVSFRATGVYDDSSTRDVSESATWSSSLSSKATVSNAPATRGVATAAAAGSTTIRAAIGSVYDETTLTVVAGAVTGIRIDPAVPSVGVGRTLALRCLGAIGGGPEVDLTGLATWSSDAPDVASVSGGDVSGVKAGTALITATYGGFTANATVTVSVQPPALTGLELSLPPGAQLAEGSAGWIRAVAVYDDGSRKTVTPLASFTSSAPAVLAFHMTGEYRAHSTGAATVTATWGGKAASAAIQVVPNAISALVVDPAPRLLPAGDVLQLHATALRLDGTALDVPDAIWTTDAPEIVSVDPTGVATAWAAGNAVVRATYGGLSAATVVHVTGSTVTSLALSSTTVALVVGATSSSSGTLWFADGASAPAAEVARLVVADDTVVSVGRRADGTFSYRGLALGTTTVEVSAGGVTRTVNVQVSAPSSLSLTVPPVTVVGVEQQIGATAGPGSAAVSDVAQWSSDAPAIAEVTRDARGYPRLVARAAGTAHITASLAGRTATATVTVVAPPVWLEVTPASFDVPYLQSQPLTVTGHLASGGEVNLTRAVDWLLDHPSVGYVYSGTFYAGTPGTTTLTAIVAGVTAQAAVVVWPESPSAITIAPSLANGASGPYTLPPGAVVRFSVIPQYSFSVSGRPPLVVTWTSADPGVAAFSTDPAKRGELTATGEGTTTITATVALPTGGTRSATATVRVAPLVSIAVSPAAAGVMPTEAKTLAVTGTFDPEAAASFTADVTPWATWTTDAPEVARPVSLQNLWFMTPGVFGVSPGAAVLTASFGGASVDVPVIGLPPSVSSVTIAYYSPGSAGLTFSPTASAVLVPNGRSVDVTNLATWSADGTVLGVSATPPPVVSLLQPGSGWIRAAFGGKTATSNTTVVSYPYDALVPDARRMTLAPGTSRSFEVREYRQNYQGDAVGKYSSVASSNPAVATASPQSGGISVRAHAPGEAIVTASFGGVDARVAVNVFGMDGEPWLWDEGIKVLHVHERAAFSAFESVSALALSFVNRSGLTWTSSDPSVVAVTGTGSVHALKPGRAVITASSRTWKASFPVTVSSAALVGIAPSTPAVPLPVGAVEPLRAYARYSDGASVDVTGDVTWWSADASAAAFDGAPGVVRALAPGTTRVECRLGDLTGYAIVTAF